MNSHCRTQSCLGLDPLVFQADAGQQILLDLAQGRQPRRCSSETVSLLQQHGLLESGGESQVRLVFDPLDPQRIATYLPVEAAQRLGRLDVHAVSLSTQALATEGDGAFFAEHQTGGRGRRGRNWQSLAGGSLQFSLGRTLSALPPTPGALPLAVAVAVAETLRRHAADVVIKWPNDILCSQGKLAGILLDMLSRGGQARLVCGVGLNIDSPSGIDQPASGLADISAERPDRSRLAAELLGAIDEVLQAFQCYGFSPLAERYAALDGLRGRMVQLRPGGDQPLLNGKVLGVAEDGALRLETSGGEHRYYSAEVQLERFVTC